MNLERLLRANLLQPKLNIEEIELRQASVKKLKASAHVHHQLLGCNLVAN